MAELMAWIGKRGMAPVSARQEAASADESFNLPTEDIHRIVANHLREQFRAPDRWLSGLLEHADGLDEATIRQALQDLDAAWNLFTEWTQSDSLFRLISRITIYPDCAGIEISMPALGQLVCEMAQGRHQAEAGHANRRSLPTAVKAPGKPTTRPPRK